MLLTDTCTYALTHEYTCIRGNSLVSLFCFRVGCCAPHVVDVNWRLDYYIKVQGELVVMTYGIVCDWIDCRVTALNE